MVESGPIVAIVAKTTAGIFFPSMKQSAAPVPAPPMADAPLQQATTRMLRPLVRLLLRHGITHATLSQWLKRLYVETAASTAGLDDRRPSLSRIALVTGIHRKEVRRVLDEPSPADDHPPRHNRAARVVHGWMRDTDFLDAGKPRELPFAGDGADFGELVKRYSGDIPARAVLDELLRTGIVSRGDDDKIRLVKPGYVPCRSDGEMLRLAAEAVRDLLETVDYNLAQAGSASRLQLSVAYDNLPDEAVAAFRRLGRERAMELLHEMDAFLRRHDRDANPASTGKGRHRAGIGIYCFEEPQDHEE